MDNKSFELTSGNGKPYYITTAIAYTSRKPHIGNSYEIVLADAIARFRRMQGYDVFFMTGTDEHGQKIENYARDAGVSPKEYVDKVAGEIRDICDMLGTSYDKFIRTTDKDHEQTVQKIFLKLYEQGDIYKSYYEGMYCTPCESFWTSSQLVDGKCPDCGGEVQPAREEAYFLKLSKYQKQLEDYIEAHPDFIYPEARKNEMLNNFIRPGLQDLCVSRTSFKWGIPVTFDPGHVIYVWIDALSNYITGIGYDPDGSGEMYRKFWPADVHIIGKDIIRFHTIYWPIMLMALGEPLPKQVYGHPWLLFGEDKMSKSKGNVIYAEDLVRRFGVDAVRYYLLSEMPHARDGSISYATMSERYNSDLANSIGNLVNRTVAMVNKYFDGVLPVNTVSDPLDDSFKADIMSAVPAVEKAFDEFRIADAAEAILNAAKRANKYIDETAPWALAKDEANKERLSTVLYNLVEAIRIVAVELSPFIPETSAKMLEQIGTDIASYDSLSSFGALEAGHKVGVAEPLFARIDTEALAAELQAELASRENNKKLAEEIGNAEQISIDDFAKCDIRVCEVIACEKIKKAKKLLKFTLNDGTGRERVIVSGIAAYYQPEELVGKHVAAILNLKPVTLCGVESRGMIISAESPDGELHVITAPDSPAGSKLC